MSRDDPWLRLEALKLAVSGRLLRPLNDGPEGVAEDVKTADAFLDWLVPPPKKKLVGTLGWAIAKGLKLGHGIRRATWQVGYVIEPGNLTAEIGIEDMLAEDWRFIENTVYRNDSARTPPE